MLTHPLGPVCLTPDDNGRLPYLGRMIVDRRREAVMRARLAATPPMHPAWNDCCCWPGDWSESQHAIAPETLVLSERSVTLVGEIGGAHALTSTPHAYDEPEPSECADMIARIMAKFGR